MTGQDQTDTAAGRSDPARVAARAAFDRAIAGDPDLGALDIGAILRAAPDRCVAEAWLDGTPVIAKLFTGPDAAGVVTALAAELALLAPRLSTGRAQVNRCLIARPDLGLAVLSRLPGVKMSRLLPTAPPEARARMLADAGTLLLAYSEGRRTPGQIGPAWWMKKFDRFDVARLRPVDRDLLTGLHAALFAQTAALRGATLCKAAVHGDFVPANLTADENGVYAFDIQGEARMPLSYDIARFLAWLAADPQQPPGPNWLGVAETDLRAFLVPGLPAEGEAPGILPFVLGHQIAARLYERHDDPATAPAARRAARRYLRKIGSAGSPGP